MAENLTVLGGDIAPGLKKGTVSTGEIIRMTLGIATDFMTNEQVAARKVRPEMKFVEMEMVEKETGTIFNKTFRYYEGSIPENSVQGQLISTYGDLHENDTINLIAKETGRADNKFVVWDLILA